VTITGAEVALEKVVEVPRLRPVTALGVTGIVAAMVTGLLAGCGDAAGGAATAGSVSPTGSPSSSPSSSPSGSAVPVPGETRTPARLLEQARAAFLAATSVHVTGTAVRGADAYVVDARLRGADGGTATVKTSGETVRVVRVGNDAYVGGDLAFWRSVTGDETKARQMVGTSLRTSVGQPGFAAFVAFTEPATYAAALPDPARPATLATTTTIRGESAIGVRDQTGSTLYVARTGPAHPLRLDGLTNGQVVFLDMADYGAPVPLPAPSSPSVRTPGPGS
jgi:hypothetical protein